MMEFHTSMLLQVPIQSAIMRQAVAAIPYTPCVMEHTIPSTNHHWIKCSLLVQEALCDEIPKQTMISKTRIGLTFHSRVYNKTMLLQVAAAIPHTPSFRVPTGQFIHHHWTECHSNIVEHFIPFQNSSQGHTGTNKIMPLMSSVKSIKQ